MAVITVVGAKGGSGVSLLATNLGVALAAREFCLLIDLNPLLGADDLLLDLQIEKSWLDLLPVAAELTERHLDLAAGSHESGLRLLSAPHASKIGLKRAEVAGLLKALEAKVTWMLLDLPVIEVGITSVAFPLTSMLLLVCMMDPLSLRSAKRLTAALPADLLQKTGIVFNQVGRDHPGDPGAAASSLGLPLLAVLPVDQDAVGRQVNFGQPCVADPRSRFGSEVAKLAARLTRMRSGRHLTPLTEERIPSGEAVEKKEQA